MKRINLKKQHLVTIEVLVSAYDGSDNWVDEITGMTVKDAMQNARNNWVDCAITFLDDVTEKIA